MPKASFREQTSIPVRSLGDNELGPKGGAAIAEGLKGSSTLTSLSYSPRLRIQVALLLHHCALSRPELLCLQSRE